MRAALITAMLLAAGTLSAAAQTSTAPGPGAAGSARPAQGPDQTTVSGGAPPATPHNTTATPNPDPKVRQMNSQEDQKVRVEGK